MTRSPLFSARSFRRSPRLSSLAAAGLLLAAGCGAAPPGGDPTDGTVREADTQAKSAAPAPIAIKDVSINPGAAGRAIEELGLGGDEDYSVLLLWGHVPSMPSAPTAPTAPVAASLEPRPEMTWQGSIRVVEGEIAVDRTIDAYGQPGDLQATPQSRQMVNFVSHTGSNVEGLVVHVRVPSQHAVLLFTTEQLTAFVDLRGLQTSAGHEAAMDDGVHGLAWAGFRDEGCDRQGFLYGAWTDKTDSESGRFGATVIDQRGHDAGRATGTWTGQLAGGAGSFHGYVADASGKPVRTLDGAVDVDHGQLKGSWAPASGQAGSSGTVDGIFRTAHGDGMGPGVWLGRWSESCGTGG